MDWHLGSLTDKPHHEVDGQYADSWEDCLVEGEGSFEGIDGTHYGAGPNCTLTTLCDWTDGPQTRVKFFEGGWCGESKPFRDEYAKGALYRLKPATDGQFIVTDQRATLNDTMRVVIMRGDSKMGGFAVVEKFVPIELAMSHFPIGRRFAFERAA